MSTPQTFPIVLDFLHEIFAYLDPGQYEEGSEGVILLRQSLAWSARSCQALAEAAVKVLWTNLPSDRPLLNLLRTFGFARTGWGDDLGLYQLTSSNLRELPGHPLWGRFTSYALHVRTIALYPLGTPDRSTIWKDISSVLGADPILPHLRSVTLRGQTPRLRVPFNADVLKLIHPNARRLTFLITSGEFRAWQQGHTDSVVHDIFALVTAAAPRLEVLKLGYLRLSPQVLQSNCSSIRHVQFSHNINGEMLEPLASLPTLERLSFDVDLRWTQPLTLPAMRMLAIGGMGTGIPSVLEHLALPQLRSLSINTIWVLTKTLASDTARLYTGVIASKYPSLASLSIRFRIMGFTTGHGPPQYFPVHGQPLGEIVEPLFALHGLRTLTLEMEKIDLDHSSATFEAMARSWPHLEELHIELHEERVTCAPVDSIVYFAVHCPRLRTLRLPVLDISEAALEALEGYGAAEGHALQECTVPDVMFQGDENLRRRVRHAAKAVFPRAYCIYK